MPRLEEAAEALPMTAEVLVTDAYPGAPAHAVLLIRPDGHLVAAFAGVHPEELRAAAEAARGNAPDDTAPASPVKALPAGTTDAERTPAAVSADVPAPAEASLGHDRTADVH